jgi:hypothetical protein
VATSKIPIPLDMSFNDYSGMRMAEEGPYAGFMVSGAHCEQPIKDQTRGPTNTGQESGWHGLADILAAEIRDSGVAQ